MPARIADYYKAAAEQAEQEVENASDTQVIGIDAGEWVAYLVRKWGMQPIELDDTRQREMDEIEVQRRLRGIEARTGREVVRIERLTEVRVQVPVIPSDTLQAIWRQKLAPNMRYLTTTYPEFEYDHTKGVFTKDSQPNPSAVHKAFETITEGVRRYNDSIESQTPGFEQQVARLVAARRERVLAKHDSLDALAAAVGIPLRKKVDPDTVVPITPKVRTKIAPILPPRSQPPTRPVLEQDKFESILALLDNGCRQFERTPRAFQQLTEEGLRDFMLGNLNAVFEGSAGGETFQGTGKVDIHLRLPEGEIFVAEVKFWDGADSLRTVIGQLLGRLTWRDGYGVALVLSRNVNYGNVQKVVHETIATVEGLASGTPHILAPNRFAARFAIPSDKTRQATIHVLVYNLFVPVPGKRTVKAAKSPTKP